MRRVTPRLARDFSFDRCEGNIGVEVELEERLCDGSGNGEAAKQYTNCAFV